GYEKRAVKVVESLGIPHQTLHKGLNRNRLRRLLRIRPLDARLTAPVSTGSVDIRGFGSRLLASTEPSGFASRNSGVFMPTKKSNTTPIKLAPKATPSSARSRAPSWANFLGQIRAARKDLGDPSVVWYRGHSRAYYKLVPSLLRNPAWAAKEQVLFDEYERSASRLLDKRQNDWELLIDMQHYGIPTRLFDWTDVLGISLAFALYDSSDDHEDSVVYVMDPVRLNRKSGIEGFKRVPNDSDFNYKFCYWLGKPF